MQIDLGSKKIMVIAAVNGSTTRKQHPRVPLHPRDIAQEAYECCEAGASILHVHPKGPDGGPTADLDIFGHVVEAVRAKCNMLIQIGNDLGIFRTADGNSRSASYGERLAILDVSPRFDIATINSGSFSAGGRDFLNPPEFNDQYAREARQRGMAILCQTYDFSHITGNQKLVRSGALAEPVHYSFVMGYDGGIEAHPKLLLNMVDAVPQGSAWEVVAKRNHFPILMAAIAMGGHVRTGFEDTVEIAPGQPARSNAELVEKVVRLIRDAGHEPATVDDARRAWGLRTGKGEETAR